MICVEINGVKVEIGKIQDIRITRDIQDEKLKCIIIVSSPSKHILSCALNELSEKGYRLQGGISAVSWNNSIIYLHTMCRR